MTPGEIDANTDIALDLDLLRLHIGMADELIRKYQDLGGVGIDRRQRYPVAYSSVVDAFEAGMVSAARAALAVLRNPQADATSLTHAEELILSLDQIIAGSAPVECVRYFTDLSGVDRAEIDRVARQHEAGL